MPARGFIHIPAEVLGAHSSVSLDQSANTSLATAYGTEVTGIKGQDQLHRLFMGQAIHLLQNAEPDITGAAQSHAVRSMTYPRKYEKPFWSDEIDSPTTARVLFPYTPPVWQTIEETSDVNKPLRMSFGLLRVAEYIRTARVTLWVAHDDQSPYKNNIQIRKHISGYQEHVTAESAEAYLQHPRRSEHRSRIPLQRLLAQLN